MFKIIIFAVAVSVYLVTARDLPSFIRVCHTDDPNIKECLMDSFETIRPALVKGEPDYNIPSLEPLVMNDLFSENAAGMQITVSDVSAWGCSDFIVKDMDVDFNTYHFVFHVDLPKLKIEARFNLDGKLLVMPVKGEGKMDCNITDTHARAELTGEVIEKDGEKYLRFKSFDLKVDIGGGTAHLDNLFNGDKILLGMVNDVVNKNFGMFIRELMPIIQKSLGSVFKQASNAIVENFTYDQLFPK